SRRAGARAVEERTMKKRKSETQASQLEAVLEMIRSKLPQDQSALAEPFARKYFGQVDADDLAGFPVADLYGAVLSHWHFVRRKTGSARVRVYNPRLEEHGWESTHTVVEIVSDDMPFLVDSVTMEINRQSLTLHLIIHPVMCVARDAKGHFLKLADEVSG